jgi:hypothetical protein
MQRVSHEEGDRGRVGAGIEIQGMELAFDRRYELLFPVRWFDSRESPRAGIA